MLNKTPFVALHTARQASAKQQLQLSDLLGEAIVQSTDPSSKPQVVFCVTEMDLDTTMPSVSSYKLGRLTKVSSKAEMGCILRVELREDFKFSEEEEA